MMKYRTVTLYIFLLVVTLLISLASSLSLSNNINNHDSSNVQYSGGNNNNNNVRKHRVNGLGDNYNPCGHCKNGYFCLSVQQSSSCIPDEYIKGKVDFYFDAEDGTFIGGIVNNLRNTIKAIVFSLTTEDTYPITLTNLFNATFIQSTSELVIPDDDVIYYQENFSYGFDYSENITLTLESIILH